MCVCVCVTAAAVPTVDDAGIQSNLGGARVASMIHPLLPLPFYSSHGCLWGMCDFLKHHVHRCVVLLLLLLLGGGEGVHSSFEGAKIIATASFYSQQPCEVGRLRE